MGAGEEKKGKLYLSTSLCSVSPFLNRISVLYRPKINPEEKKTWPQKSNNKFLNFYKFRSGLNKQNGVLK